MTPESTQRQTVLLISTSDTDLLSARASTVPYRLANPNRVSVDDLDGLLDGVAVAVVRLLGGTRAWEDGLNALLTKGVPVVVLSGEALPDADLMQRSTVPVGVATQAHGYLAEGGPDNLAELHAFLTDTLLLTGFGFEPPRSTPVWGVLERPTTVDDEKTRPTIAVLYYRAHHVAGNTAFVEALCTAVEDAGGRALPIFCASLRAADDELLAELGKADALLVTVLAAGGNRPANASAGGDDSTWDIGALAALDVPILQAISTLTSRERWLENSEGLIPLDAANQVAIPEFDGRLITVPFSFKEVDSDGLTQYVADPERASRAAGIAVAHARLRSLAQGDKRIALMLTAYPTKHARIGNAVGLDTPASALALLAAMRDAGYDVGPSEGEGAFPGFATMDGDALVHGLIEAGGQDLDWLSEEDLARNPVRIPAAVYRRFFSSLPEDLRAAVVESWGEAPGEMFVDPPGGENSSGDPDGDIVLAAIVAGNVVLLLQPPRGFGDNPVAIYHDPEMPPSHHYLAAYHWLNLAVAEGGFGADAVVHLGKHGTLEWTPGKTLALSASCAPDAALGNLPLIYPFLVNDPGEGTQAKRRAHATLVDHLVPPMARADSYGDIARLEQLLDEYAAVTALDPAKAPAIQTQIWTLMHAAKLDHDLGLAERPHEAEFDDMILHLDGWLCQVKDAQIRDGLHVLGQAPTGSVLVHLVTSMLRARQLWAGAQSLPGLREALGLDEASVGSGEAESDGLEEVDAAQATAVALVQGLSDASWSVEAVPAVIESVLSTAEVDVSKVDRLAVQAVLEFAATEVVPRLLRTTDELTAVLHALDGGFVSPGPSGSPLRGLVNVLPTGRNFYSVDPRAVPSRLAWETGRSMAESLLERYRTDEGDWPKSVGLSIWGTSAMRTSGDDVAEVLALLGIRPVWDDASRRITSLEALSLDELGHPRIDVTVRISGFFRDAFPHVVQMMDDAVQLAAAQDEPAEQNFVRAHVQADLAAHGDDRRATTRIFGSKPGTYGAGVLPLIDTRTWRDDADLAEVYAVWGGYAYGRGLDGRPAREDMESSYKRIAVAAKNYDSVEHDIADSDDYFQYHGGMVSMVRALTGSAPKAYIGDSTQPSAVRTRTLHEEVSRVFRSRVVNPRWVAAMQRHGYKGAFEMAATVDYLFGYDATTGVVADWMYGKLAETYVLDETQQKFMTDSNPWALHGITERLLEAAERGLWAEPSPEMLDALREVFLRTEGDLEGK
ncbi:cobaltochelatase subunit CobN [Kineosporia sp. J2-2]|uniref:Cobaltochelatase subunit CobN n=1 Tax=Kineosporia corallincola TaxID=2835133 RepID=A0ABS5TG51_9ACTN|nr:cobaltochelatase subunit CobN [Kineosporia corallincola]MBT0769364.1 cobaltochelatase subunit CobN [Kineosporia corallincola]